MFNQKKWIVESGNLEISFDSAKGPLPESVSARLFDGTLLEVLKRGENKFSICADGNILHPEITEEPAVYDSEGASHVIFSNLAWADSEGKVFPDFHAIISHEFFPDGSAFSSLFFIASTAVSPELKDFILGYSADFDSFDDIRFATVHRRGKVDGAVIQDMTPVRFEAFGSDHSYNEITPLVSFYGFRNGAESLYSEFFMEGGATLSGKCGENSTSVTWNGRSPRVEWNFQTVPLRRKGLAVQMRNYWGWVIRTPGRQRVLPPMTMYHYLDNFRHYPALEELDAMAGSGCDILTIHENWRLDPQNDGLPFDEKMFRFIVDEAHKRSIRVAVYIRGSEHSAQELSCAWFDRYLRKDYDGLYMDYGGPFHYMEPPCESFCDGRNSFRRHYFNLKKLRERVGEKGIFFGHTGPSYSALGMNFLTGYVSGEGEKGVLVKGRREHEYFSMAANSCGTMWTAAFPEYATNLMTPFLASTGQFPHNPLGCQFRSSSLTHSPEPGVNDVEFRPLWKLWSLLRNENNLAVFNDYNSSGIFRYDKECGHCMMISGDRAKALLVVSNFSDSKRVFDVSPAWGKMDFQPDGKKCFRLLPDVRTPGVPEEFKEEKLEMTLAAHSCGGFFWSTSPVDFADFEKPYHVPCGSGMKFMLENIEEKRLRENPPVWKNVILTAKIDQGSLSGYEDSLLIDLYANEMFIVEFEPDGKFRKLAKLENEAGGNLFAGDTSVPVRLDRLLGKGEHSLGLYTTHYGEPFYNFAHLVLSNGSGESYTLSFRNEVEPDRAFIHWKSIIG